jgi:hypothetical protein
LGSIRFLEAVSRQARGWFTRGFTLSEIPPPLNEAVDDRRIFMPCIRDSPRLQLTAMHENDIQLLASSVVRDAHPVQLHQLHGHGAMSEDEIRHDLLLHVPELADLIEEWDGSPLHQLTLTSVGIAIGHGYWRLILRNAGLDDEAEQLSRGYRDALRAS